MKQSESRRFTFFIAVYCVAFTVILCARYFLYRAVCPPRPRRGAIASGRPNRRACSQPFENRRPAARGPATDSRNKKGSFI